MCCYTDVMARTHKKVSYSPTGKLEDVTPDMAASGIESAFRILEGRWKMVIVFHLFARGILRFSELEKAIPAASPKMLTQQLRELERDGVVSRTVYPRAAQGRVPSDRLGKGDVPGARRPARMGRATTEACAARPVRQLTRHERRKGRTWIHRTSRGDGGNRAPAAATTTKSP